MKTIPYGVHKHKKNEPNIHSDRTHPFPNLFNAVIRYSDLISLRYAVCSTPVKSYAQRSSFVQQTSNMFIMLNNPSSFGEHLYLCIPHYYEGKWNLGKPHPASLPTFIWIVCINSPFVVEHIFVNVVPCDPPFSDQNIIERGSLLVH